ncbi:P-loop containing nucleoside triphosphate hydrolase protein [Acrodontium crateriforme]|uniref:RNA helicase n=1 Tax=Acrodontium crateriforme TaxID=150365 RepID=A0AAQ3M0B3_9PEZI|nr:P-loop containing nucleoside triphosphate hydrolase protein [Acrodontium crateriforme]
MARSPARRHNDRYERDSRDDRHRYSARPRSRNRERRNDDRDRDYDRRGGAGRRDRSRDRYRYDDRGSRRDRSPPNKRSREVSPVRERNSGGRSERENYDGRNRDRNEHDRKRARHDDDDRRRPSSRDRGSQRGSVRDKDSPAPSTVDAEEAKIRERQAKVEAWKAKMEERKKAQTANAGANTSEVDRGTSSPAPLSAAMSPSTAANSPGPLKADDKPSSPAPYAGKFDPKAIAKRAAAAMEREKKALGGEVAIPKSATEASTMNGTTLANPSKVAPARFMNGKIPNGNAKISGFGLNKASAGDKAANSSAMKSSTALDDEETVTRKLEKLPDMPAIDDTGDTAQTNQVEDHDEGGDEIHSDEEEAEAAREAAQRRAQGIRAEENDVAMADADSKVVESTSTAADVDMDEEEEIDPLDAFMNTLEAPPDNKLPNLNIGKSKKNELQVFNSDDEGDLDAIGDDTGNVLAAIAAKRKKKDIPTVNHAKMQYEPFRKNFYSESVELAEMTDEDVDILRAELDNITVRGKDPPKPILKWSQGGFGAQILDVIRDMKYEKPTSIQSQALPAIMSGRDTIGIAKTGSGKTMAFILPMFRHIKDQRPLQNLEGPVGLILAPTRELATQIHRDCKPYLKALNLRAVCAYGGAPIKDQIAELKRGAEIVVCTAGRMIDLLAANGGRVTNLNRVTYVVLDEADRMFDMGFEPQITKILNNIRPERQTVLFSATFPRNMEALARKALTRPVEILVGGRSVVAAEITQVIEVREEGSKFHRLLQLLGDLHDKDEDARSLIFVERQETADSLLKDLLRKGYPCGSIHGGREQIDRDEAISDFKAGIFPVLIATSVAARGLDVKQLKLVVNFDSPNHIEDYVHRVGRTGRAGNTGTAVTFVTPQQDRFASFLIKALTDSNQEIPEDLKKLEETHKEKVKAGEAKKASSGFGGKGIERLDAARDAERAREKKQYKTGDEPDEEEEEEGPNKGKASEVEKLLAKATGVIKDRDAAPPPQESSGIVPTALQDHLNNAMKVQKIEKPAPSQAVANDPLARVKAAAAGINSRLGARGKLLWKSVSGAILTRFTGATRPGAPIDNRGPDAGAFHATLEINDFPQKARWAVTNRTNVAKILESTGTSITSKGNYYAPGKEPAVGDQPKLYILVEGDTEVVVSNAMTELTRLLREGTVAAYEAESKAPVSGGRYSVI